MVNVLTSAGIETFESCEGGAGHAYPEPTVRFHGHRAEGFRALAVALEYGPPSEGLTAGLASVGRGTDGAVLGDGIRQCEDDEEAETDQDDAKEESPRGRC